MTNAAAAANAVVVVAEHGHDLLLYGVMPCLSNRARDDNGRL